jgi:hypothetical protein
MYMYITFGYSQVLNQIAAFVTTTMYDLSTCMYFYKDSLSLSLSPSPKPVPEVKVVSNSLTEEETSSTSGSWVKEDRSR